MLGLTNDGIGAPEYCCGAIGCEVDGRATLEIVWCISGNVGNSWVPEGIFRGGGSVGLLVA